MVPDVVTRRAAAVAIGKPFTEFREVALEAASLDAVAGAYTHEKEPQRVFQRDAAGKASGVTYHQDGRALAHARSGDAPPPRVVAKISDAAFDARAGRYEIQPGMVLEVSRDGGRYYLQPSGQRRVEIFPLSESRFFARDVEADISFEEGGMIFRQGGRSHTGRRI